MSTPLDRVNRFREETAKATEGPWTSEQDEHQWPGQPRPTEYWQLVHLTTQPSGFPGHPLNVVKTNGDSGWPPTEADGDHMARWDPVAAGKVLDLLERVFTRHVWDKDSEWCRGCRCAQYPCPDLTDALAALDQLDGGSTT